MSVSVTVLNIGAARFRVGAWQGDARLAYLTPITAAATLAPVVLAEVREQLVRRGYAAVMTSALAATARDLLIDDGYTVRAELVTLSRSLDNSAALPRAPRRTRRARHGDLEAVLRVDAAAFGSFWRIDGNGLRDAREATPRSRWRVNQGSPVAAYSISGRSGAAGFLQRLAVAPQHQGQGLGTMLVSDSLRWLRSSGARTVQVNTPPDNTRALALYERCGFRVDHERLAVLYRSLT